MSDGTKSIAGVVCGKVKYNATLGMLNWDTKLE